MARPHRVSSRQGQREELNWAGMVAPPFIAQMMVLSTLHVLKRWIRPDEGVGLDPTVFPKGKGGCDMWSQRLFSPECCVLFD